MRTQDARWNLVRSDDPIENAASIGKFSGLWKCRRVHKRGIAKLEAKLCDKYVKITLIG